MPGIFISHSSRDNQVADEVAQRLRQQGFQSLFLDFDPADGIPAGRNWEQELYGQLRRCSGVVLLCSEHSMASDWCFAEITHARALGKHLFPVVIAPCELRPILRDTQVTDLTGDPEEGYRRLWRGLQAAGLNPADVLAWDEKRPPYPGLVPFLREDAAVFFGRDDDRRRCVDTLEQMSRYGGDRLLVIMGASGSGKSSLVRAGVVPHLENMPDWLVLDPMRPGQQPVEELGRALSQAFARARQPVGGPPLSDRLRQSRDGGALTAIVGELQDAVGRARPRVLLVIDQLEELITTSDPEGAAAFVALIKGALAGESGQLFCVATLRSDYLAALQVQPLWQGLAFRNLTLGPMAAEHFVEAITRPAEVAGIELEDGLVDRMLRDTGSADALPLLAFTLNRLWREYGRVDGRITIAEYAERIGGIEGSIRQEAEGVLAALDPTPQQLAELKRAFRLMVRVNEEGQYTRRPVRRAELPAATRPLLEAFVRARLLVSGGEDSNFPDVPATPAGKDAGTLEVAHEALFRAWDTLKDWLDEDRAFLLWRQRVEREENAWRAAPKDQGLLLRGGRLAEAQRWLAERSEDVGAATAAFIRASRALARRIAWIWRGLGAATAVGLVIATVLAVLWWNARQDTLEQLINSYWNIAIAARDGEGDALRAAHYFSRAADLTSNPAERDSALLSAGLLSGGVVLENVFQLEAPPAAVFTAADQPLAVFHMAKEVHLWDLDTGTKLPPLPHSGELKESLVAAEGSVVSWGEGTEIFLWGRGRPTVPLSHEGPVAGALLNRDGTALLSWDEAGTARVWDAATGAQRACFAHPGPVRGARFLDAPGRVLTWNTDAMLRVWHSDQNGPPAACRTEPPLPAWSQSCEDGKLAIHVDGGAALGWCGKNLAVHDLVRGRLMTPPWSSPEPVDGALFLPGGKTVATWNLGAGRVRVWDTQGGTENYPPIEHEGGIHRVLLTPDGERLNTAGEDGRIRSWDVELGEEAARADHTAGRGRVLASLGHSGTRVLGWAEESGARLWDTRTLTPLSLPLGPDGGALGAGFFHQDQQILTWGRDGVVRIWRRQPSLELTASVGRPGTEAAEISATPSVASPAERRAMSEAGLADYEVLARGERSLLLGAGTEARVMTPGVPGTRVSPPLTLDGDILGAVFAAQGDRVALWGESSVRFWDAPSGRPLSALLRSDVLLPAAAKTEDGLLVWDDDGARIWRWTLAVPQTIPSAEAWLQAVSGTRLDARNELRLLTPEEWCEAARKSGRQPAPAGCAR